MFAKIDISGKLTEDQITALRLSTDTPDEVKVYGEDCEYESLRGQLQNYGTIYDLRKVHSFHELRGSYMRIELQCDKALNPLVEIATRLASLEGKTARYTHSVPDLSNPYSSGNPQYNSRVNVHVPNLGMLAMNEVQLEEDCCTDRLQRLLEDGWRILAICPQPDQRRPDYILGRTQTNE